MTGSDRGVQGTSGSRSSMATYLSFVNDVNATCLGDIAFILLAVVVSWGHDIRWVPLHFPHGVYLKGDFYLFEKSKLDWPIIVWSFIAFADTERAGNATMAIHLN
jgi:hypothetical protein